MNIAIKLSALALGITLAYGGSLTGAQAQDPPAPTTRDRVDHTDHSAKQDMRDAGHDSKNAARDAGHGIKTGTKHAYRSTKHGVRKGARKTKNTVKGAVDGGKAGAKEPTNPRP